MGFGSTLNTILYIFIFLSIYVQVFFFVTFLENRKKIVRRNGKISLSSYPMVTIAVPCWNEEGTVVKTVESLLSLNYPKESLQILLINDGSTDRTPEILEQFAGYPNISVFHKENGGKHTALNLALQNIKGDFFGCLDADSFADPEALVRIMSYFEKDPKAMAVTPSIAVYNPKGVIQRAQKAEYEMGVYMKKMLGLFNAINVTPGPMTIFRKKVFDDLGPYRHGHNTEDMEIAYRMQKHGYKIDHCNDAFVYTATPPSVRKLYRQRTRWVYGFINNTIDYRHVIFRKKYGNFAIFTLPVGIISFLSVIFLFTKIIYNFFHYIVSKVELYQAVGFHPGTLVHFDLFFLNTQMILFLMLLTYGFVVFSIMYGQKMIENRWYASLDILYFVSIFSLTAPFWLLKAVYNTLVNRKPSWR